MGAALLGPAAFIWEARRVQCLLGGVMRQVVLMAAAALYGFRHNLERLAEDHANCLLITQRLPGHPALDIDPAGVQSNILCCQLKAGPERAARLVKELAQHGIGSPASSAEMLRHRFVPKPGSVCWN